MTALSKSESIKIFEHLPSIDDQGISSLYGRQRYNHNVQKKSRFSEPEIVEAFAKVITSCESLTYVSFEDMGLDAASTATFLTAYGQSKAFARTGSLPKIAAQHENDEQVVQALVNLISQSS